MRTAPAIVVALLALASAPSAHALTKADGVRLWWSDGVSWSDSVFEEEYYTPPDLDEDEVPGIVVRARGLAGVAVLEFQNEDGTWTREDSRRLRRGRALLDVNPWCEFEGIVWCSGSWTYRVRIGRYLSPPALVTFVPAEQVVYGERPDITDLP